MLVVAETYRFANVVCRSRRVRPMSLMGLGRDGVDASPTALMCQSGGVGHH